MWEQRGGNFWRIANFSVGYSFRCRSRRQALKIGYSTGDGLLPLITSWNVCDGGTQVVEGETSSLAWKHQKAYYKLDFKCFTSFQSFVRQPRRQPRSDERHWERGCHVEHSVKGQSDPGEGTHLYQVYTVCAAPKGIVWFLSRFGLKTGIDFEHFDLKLGMVIGGMFTKV